MEEMDTTANEQPVESTSTETDTTAQPASAEEPTLISNESQPEENQTPGGGESNIESEPIQDTVPDSDAVRDETNTDLPVDNPEQAQEDQSEPVEDGIAQPQSGGTYCLYVILYDTVTCFTPYHTILT